MGIVVDTNVFIGACLGVGASSAVVARCLQGAYVPLMGTALFSELIALALAGGASHIVTRNVRDVAAMELRFPHLAVLTPERFLKEQGK